MFLPQHLLIGQALLGLDELNHRAQIHLDSGSRGFHWDIDEYD